MAANQINETEFNRTKIYEKLDYEKEPDGYRSNIPWIVQQQIAATNGIHYKDRIGKLSEYPVYELPVPAVQQGLMLDIGNGWGRWLVAGANKGYTPIGIDIRLEFCMTARETLRRLNKQGYSLVADLRQLPFKAGIFDLVWSFSVIQHTHKDRLMDCLQHINRILRTDGYTFLEFPNKNGIRNRVGPARIYESEKNDYNSWCVRYYTPSEYRDLFMDIFGNFSFSCHSFLGIGILKEDMKYVSPKNKIISAASLTGTYVSKVITPLKYIADSLYVKSTAGKNNRRDDMQSLEIFALLQKQNPTDNLNVWPLLQCPQHGTGLTLSADRKRLVAAAAGIYYPVENDIPVLIASEARPL
jgi:SAM-dependent methyltransferase/uncharacterized protein YbaR (Trm112 family)